jgi:hypothetical protein
MESHSQMVRRELEIAPNELGYQLTGRPTSPNGYVPLRVYPKQVGTDLRS